MNLGNTNSPKGSFSRFAASVAAGIATLPRHLGNFTIGLVDFLIQLFPRVVRGSLLLIAVGAAITLTYVAFRAMWWVAGLGGEWFSR